MDSTIEAPPDEGEMPVNGYISNASWQTPQTPTANANSILFIAVEYAIKDAHDFKYEADASFSLPPSNYSDFDQHVSPLDPNMGSTARYSPVYTDTVDVSTSYNNPVVVLQSHNSMISSSAADTQYVHSNVGNSGFVNALANNEAALEEISTTLTTADNNLLSQVVSNRYLQMVNDEASPTVASPPPSPSGLHLVPLEQYDSTIKNDQGQVELLITDQSTGISYSVSQDYLVGRSLSEEQQLLDALAPVPLLDSSDLLALDETALALKSHLNDIESLTVDMIKEEVDSGVSLEMPVSLSNGGDEIKDVVDMNLECIGATLETELEHLRRSRRQISGKDIEKDDALLTEVQSISDKPVPTRARATLPESYLVINKQNDENGVFARKLIPKRTQFGPIEGVRLGVVATYPAVDKKLHLLIESETGMHYLDVSDEHTSNWMRFVRPAKTFIEQNLALSQQGGSLYYTTTRNVLPKQELLVGYSGLYADKRKLDVLKCETDEYLWPCFECSLSFQTSNELQNHLNVHDAGKNENTKPKCKKNKRKLINGKKFRRAELFNCTTCNKSFTRLFLLKKHSSEHDDAADKGKTTASKEKIYRCENCMLSFSTVDILKIHMSSHSSGDKVVEGTTTNCPSCKNEFVNYNKLVRHVEEHAIIIRTTIKPPIVGYKCKVCYKVFALRERLQRHMIVHGSEELKPLKCETCCKRFLNNSALACHLKTHKTDKKIFECPICKESFDHVLLLKEHVRKHCADGKFTCPHCFKIFREYSIIRKHIRAFHCDRKHNCQHCDKPFPTLDKLRMHLLRHSDHREFLCADCGKQFKRKDKLKEHIKRMHSGEREPSLPKQAKPVQSPVKKFTPKVQPTDYHRFIYKCHTCMVGFKRRGMLVNHLAKRHPDISPDSVPELNLPILRTTRDYYCQYCDKVYKSSSKRKAHILKNHPGAELPMSNRKRAGVPEAPGEPNPTFSQTVGSVTTHPHGCQWCHKQYASKAKLLQHQRKKHAEQMCGQAPRSRTERQKEHHINNADSPDSLSPNADVISAHCPAPDESASIAGLDSSGYTIVSYGKCDEIAINEQDFKRDFKVTEELLSEVDPMDDFNTGRTAQYYQLIQMSSGQYTLSETPEYTTGQTESSRLYRLLNTSAVPPR